MQPQQGIAYTTIFWANHTRTKNHKTSHTCRVRCGGFLHIRVQTSSQCTCMHIYIVFYLWRWVLVEHELIPGWRCRYWASNRSSTARVQSRLLRQTAARLNTGRAPSTTRILNKSHCAHREANQRKEPAQTCKQASVKHRTYRQKAHAEKCHAKDGTPRRITTRKRN